VPFALMYLPIQQLFALKQRFAAAPDVGGRN